MTGRLSGTGGAAVVLALGAVLLRITLGGEYVRYVRVGMKPYLLLAAVALLVLGLRSLLVALRRGRGGHTPAAGLLLLAPLVVVVLVAPPALGSYAAARTAQIRGTLHPAAQLPAATDGAVTLAVGDFVGRTAVGQDLTRGRYRLTGFASPAPGGAPGSFLLTRLQIVCCAADAQSVAVTVIDAPSVPSAGRWVTVVGSEVVGDQGEPELQVVSMRATAPPQDPYEH